MSRMHKSMMQQCGAVLVELVFITPVFLGIVFAGVEFTRTLKSYETMSSISNATVNSAYRDCAYQANVQTCLNSIVTSTAPYLATSFPGSEIILSVYRLDTSTMTVSLVGIAGADSITMQTPNGNVSHYNATTITSQLQSLTIANNYIAISEMYFPQNTVVSFLGSFLAYNPGVLYEATIY